MAPPAQLLRALGKLRGKRVWPPMVPSPLAAPAVALLLAVLTDAPPWRVAAAVWIVACLALIALRGDK